MQKSAGMRSRGRARRSHRGQEGVNHSPRNKFADRSAAAAASTTRSIHYAPPSLRRLSRPASSGRRASDVAVPPRSRPRRAARPARLRRILVRRAPFERLGDDRLARDVPRRGRRALEAHQARHRRHLAALSPPVQCRAAHGAARLDDRRAGDLRLRARARSPRTRTRSASTRWCSATARTRRSAIIRRLFAASG